MTKTIKVEDKVYTQLEAFRSKRETFSQAVERALTLLSKVGELRNILEGGIKYDEWKREQATKAAPADVGSSSGQVSDVQTG